MTRARIRRRCAVCDAPLKPGKGRPCPRGCGAWLCRIRHLPECRDVHGGQCVLLQLPDEDAA